jgi:hypothetical protein
MIMAKVVEDVDNDSAYFNGKWMMNTAAGMSLSYLPTAPDLKKF